MKQPTQEEWNAFYMAEAQWETNAVKMAKFRREFFPLGTRVHVGSAKFDGFGIVSTGACATNQIPVLLESGNVWFYDMSDCEPAPEASKV